MTQSSTPNSTEPTLGQFDALELQIKRIRNVLEASLGPWHVEAPPTADNGNPWRVADEAHQTIAIVTKFPQERHARLIAAMPRMLSALRIAELHLSISDDTCADATPDGNRCLECLGCSVDMARNEVRKALTEAGSGPL